MQPLGVPKVPLEVGKRFLWACGVTCPDGCFFPTQRPRCGGAGKRCEAAAPPCGKAARWDLGAFEGMFDGPVLGFLERDAKGKPPLLKRLPPLKDTPLPFLPAAGKAEHIFEKASHSKLKSPVLPGHIKPTSITVGCMIEANVWDLDASRGHNTFLRSPNSFLVCLVHYRHVCCFRQRFAHQAIEVYFLSSGLSFQKRST